MAIGKKKPFPGSGKLHVRKGDNVVILTGKDKGKKGKILTAFPKAGRIVVEGINIVTKHQKARGQGMPGGIIHQEAAIFSSNVMLLCEKCGRPTRIAHTFHQDGSKVRVCKKCDAEFDN